MKFAERLIVIIMFAVIISSSILGYIGYITARGALEGRIGESQLELAKETLDKIDRIMYQKLQEIQVIAKATPIENSLLIGDEESSKIAKTRLKEFKFQTGPWDELEIFSTDGINILSFEKQEIGRSVEGHDKGGINAISEALQGNVHISDLIISEETKRPTVIFAAPIRNDQKDGTPVIGVVIGKFSWPVILEILDEVEVLRDRQVRLFNKNGMTIGTTTIHRDEILQHDLQNIPIVQEALKGKCSSSIAEEEFHQEDDIHAAREHIPSLSSCALQQGHLGYKGNGWGLIIETRQSRIFAPVQNLAKTFLLAALAVALLLTPVIFILSRSITKPIKKLKESADKISKGFFEEPIEIKGKDEVSELAESFDNMRYSLKLVIDEYEKMKGKEELQKNLQILEKKQEETIKNLRISIAEQKIAQSAEQKALKNYREMEEKLEHLSNFPEANPNMVLEIGSLGKIIYSNAAAKNYAKKLNVSIKSLLPGNYTSIVKKLSGSEKIVRINSKIKGKNYIYSFAGIKNRKSVFATGVEVKSYTRG
jgi:methyl-accepting chemotaxis protein